MRWADFMQYVQPDAPGCPAFVAERAIRDATIELCRQTDVYKGDPDTLNIVPGVIDYDLPSQAGVEINRVLDIHRKGVPLTKLGQVREVYELIGDDGHQEPPLYYSADDNVSIKVARRPKDAEALTIFYSLKPDASSTTIPDTIGREYRHLIAKGAKAELLQMNGQPWSNPNMGLLFEQQFRKGIAGIIRQVKFGFSGASLRVKSRPFI